MAVLDTQGKVATDRNIVRCDKAIMYTYRIESAPVKREVFRLASRASAYLAVFFAAAAGLGAFLANKYASVDHALYNLVEWLTWLPTKQWSSGTIYPRLAAIYVLLVMPVVPFSAAANFLNQVYNYPDVKSRYINERDLIFKRYVASLFLMTVAILGLVFMDGKDARSFHFASSLPTLIWFGWWPYAFLGVLFSFGAFLFWKTLWPY